MHSVTVEITVNKPISHVWECWRKPEYITQWNFAADSWCCPTATNNLEPGGKFSWRMEAKDGSMGFDYSGEYISIKPHSEINKVLDDGRKVTITFQDLGQSTHVIETFEIEDQNTADMQRTGWQAILENFRNVCEEG